MPAGLKDVVGRVGKAAKTLIGIKEFELFTLEEIDAATEEILAEERKQAEKIAQKRLQFMEQSKQKVKIEVVRRSTVDDVEMLIDRIKAHEIVIINYEALPDKIAHSIHHSLLGAIYALSGTLKQASDKVFIYYI